jgi:predicted nucleic acid-binding protein
LAIRLPAAVVDALGLQEGDQIEIQVAGKRAFDVSKAPSTRELLTRLRKFRGKLPANFKFDRLEDFFDTSVLLYLLSADTDKADRVEQLLAGRGTISVQVLNEFAAVALRRLRIPLGDVRELLATVRAVCSVEAVTVATHDRGLAIHERYRFSFYDSILVASALIAGAQVLYSEDLQDGQVIESQLRVVNPFLMRDEN